MIGSVLASKWSALGHSVSIANSRGPETIRDVAQKTGATATTVTDVVKGADVIVVTIPQKNVVNLPKHLFRDVPASTVVIDTGNYYPTLRDGHIDALDNGLPESEWVEQQIGRAVVKVFNNIGFTNLDQFGVPAGTAGRIALPVAGDDPAAKDVVFKLVDAIGFDPVDGGSIAESWRQEPGTPVYCTDYDADGVRRGLKAADKQRKIVIREKSVQEIIKFKGVFPPPKEMVNMIRTLLSQ